MRGIALDSSLLLVLLAVSLSLVLSSLLSLPLAWPPAMWRRRSSSRAWTGEGIASPDDAQMHGLGNKISRAFLVSFIR
jgi:hypothetical protein